MSRPMLSFMRRSDGSVSLYLIAITAAVFFFMAVLIDYARIAAFERQTESAAYAAARSVLSAYDGTLYARYGLFGRGGTDSAEIAAHVLESHADASRRSDRMELLRIRIEEVNVQDEGMLGNHAILKRQILEEMKYKAPIDLATEVAGKFRAVSGAMDEATRTVNHLEEARKLYDRRQRHLLAALGYQQNAAAALSGSGVDGLIPMPSVGVASQGANTAKGIAAGYPAFAGWVEADRNALEAWRLASEAHSRSGSEGPLPPAPPLHTAEIQAYASQARSAAQEIRQASRIASGQHANLLQAARNELDAAETINARIASLSRQAAHSPDSGSGKLANSKTAAVGGSGQPAAPAMEGEMKSLREATDKLALPTEWFRQYRDEIREQGTALASVDAASAAFQSSVLNALAAPSSARALMLTEQAASLAEAYRYYADRYAGAATVLTARERGIRSGQGADEERAKLEKQAATKMGEARKLLGQIAALPKTSEAIESYRRLEGLYDRNVSWNDAVREAEASADEEVEAWEGAEPSGHSDTYAKGTMNRTDELFGGLAELLGDARDELYLNEYAVHRFVSFQPHHLGVMTAADKPSGEALAAAIALHNQEVEYVIYGMHDPVSNLAAAYGEIFALRVAIRTMEGLIEKRPLGHPLVVLAAAVLYGIEKALEDMASLAQRGTTPLSKFAPIPIEYRDYLRLFLFLHGSEKAKLSRITALIEHHTGYNLHAVPTAISSTVESSVNLWFVPGIAGALARSGVLRGKVEEGRYETTRTVAWSY